ncbi:MAG: hypothetical protein R3E50_02980 [Halioglobus sp.]
MAKNNDRGHIRIKMDTRVFVEAEAATDIAEGVLLECKVVDVSYSGIKASIDRELPVGAILSVCADLPGVAEPFTWRLK